MPSHWRNGATVAHNGGMREGGAVGAAQVLPWSWIGARLHPFNQDTGSVVPEGFDTYCRIFHPVMPADPAAPARTWTEVAVENGRLPHPSMQYHMINRPAGGSVPGIGARDQQLSWGSLPLAERVALVDLLREYTATPDACWFALWTGYADVVFDGVPLAHLPGREYGLFSGPLDSVVGASHLAFGGRSANIWWPEDRRWIVVSEIDFAWTYVGGPAHLAEDLLSHRDLEVMEVKLSDKPFFGSDHLNASLDE